MFRSSRHTLTTVVICVTLGGCGPCTQLGTTYSDAGNFEFSKDAGTVEHYPDGGVDHVPDSGSTGLTCSPRTCADIHANCGPVADGCGHLIQCGECDGGTCGGGGTASVCGTGVTCVPRSCQAAGANCGPVADGCGSTIECGTCGTGSVCGASGEASVCSGTNVTPCTGLCAQQVQCPNGGTTSISGKVYAPTPSAYGSPDPLYNALVYVPNGTLAPFTPTVACETCGVPVSGDPLVQINTAADGTFTLKDVPAGSDIPLVIQLGRWRRFVKIPTVTQCQDNALTDPDMTRLPRTQFETSQWDNIPQIAMVTGSADPFECVLRKIGISDTEFTTPTGTVAGSSPARSGRVHIYKNNGASLNGAPSIDDLTGDLTTLEKYDMVILACDGQCPSGQTGGCGSMGGGRGGGYTPTTTEQSNVVTYSNEGGRVFATHFSYAWLWDVSPFSGTATWGVDGSYGGMTNSTDAVVDQTFPGGISFAAWLQAVGASTTLGNITLQQYRNDFTGINTADSQLWLSTSSGQPLHYTFNTAVGAAASAQCGRVLFSDFHVNSSGGGGGGGGGTFPSECNSDSGNLSAQEKALEFMVFDLSSCVQAGGVVAH